VSFTHQLQKTLTLVSFRSESILHTLSLLFFPQAANIPLVCELGIDKLWFDDFSLDVDAMVTAALRMFMELGMVQKFKIDYEVHTRLHFFTQQYHTHTHTRVLLY